MDNVIADINKIKGKGSATRETLFSDDWNREFFRYMLATSDNPKPKRGILSRAFKELQNEVKDMAEKKNKASIRAYGKEVMGCKRHKMPIMISCHTGEAGVEVQDFFITEEAAWELIKELTARLAYNKLEGL
jgi:hypothetical protein